MSYFSVVQQAINSIILKAGRAVPTRPTSFQDEVSIGRRGGISQFNEFAHRPDLNTADGEAFIIADSTTNAPVLLTTAETFTITYDNATDGAGGGATGALTITLYYVDDDGLDAVSTHTLGTTGSEVTSFSGFGINRCSVSSTGTSQFNVNDITITHTTNTGVAAFIPAEQGVTQQAIFFVADNDRAVAKTLLINAGKISGGGSPRVIFKGYVWNRDTATRYEIFRHLIDTGVENTLSFTDASNFPLNASDVLYFTAETDTNSTTIGSFRFSVNLYEE